MAPDPTSLGDAVSRPANPPRTGTRSSRSRSGTASPSSGRRPRRGDPPAGLDALLGGLNPEQLRAVTHGEGPLLVVAGAGTGKTQVITRRIAWLIATRRARPSEILALTFTDKAAAEMQVRVDQLVPYGYTDTAIGTFHAFGDRLIREFALELGLPSDIRVLTRAETVIFLREHLFEFELERYRPLGDPTRFLGALATLFSRCKDEDVVAGRVRRLCGPAAPRRAAAAARTDAGARRGGAAASRSSPAPTPPTGAARGERLHRLRRPGRPGAAAPAARRPPLGPRSRLASGTSSSTSSRTPTGPSRSSSRCSPSRHRNVTVVGDDDQSIYRFRGAAISNILGFRDRYPVRPDGRPAPELPLAARRSSRPSHRLIRFNDPDRLEVQAGISKRLRRGARGRSGGPRPVRLEAFATGHEEADWIAAEIAGRIDAGAAPRDIAVLVRANGHADPILRSLNLAGVPWRFSGTSGLYARPEVRLPPRVPACDRRSRRRASTSTRIATSRAVRPRRRGPDGDRQHRAAPATGRCGRSSRSSSASPASCASRPATRAAVTRLVADLRELSTIAHERPAGEVLYAFLRRTGTLSRLAGERDDRSGGAAPQHRPVLRHRPLPVGAARGRPGDVRRPATSRR